MEGKDVIGTAATGTGKTAAFLLPIIERLAGKPGTRALVLAPTRELALQIGEELERFGKTRHVRGAVVIGGVGMGLQERAFREKIEVIIATPGRLVDHLQQGTARLDLIEVLVLDEADRMLDMGFKPQLTKILQRLPRHRQTLLFSATTAGEVAEFAKAHLKAPVQVEVARSRTTAARAEQRVFLCAQEEKMPPSVTLLAEDQLSTLVFTRTKRRADRVAKGVERAGHKVARIHADRSQGQRKQALDGFKDGRYRVLVATDIAARGIDVADIGHVVNFDLPARPGGLRPPRRPDRSRRRQRQGLGLLLAGGLPPAARHRAAHPRAAAPGRGAARGRGVQERARPRRGRAQAPGRAAAPPAGKWRPRWRWPRRRRPWRRRTWWRWRARRLEGQAPDGPGVTSAVQLERWRDFVLGQTAPAPVALVPGTSLYQATELTPLWHATSAQLERYDASPFWAFPWAGGQALARHLLDSPGLVRGRRVLDFATGSGLVGIAARLAGAATVDSTDLAPFCEVVVPMNASLNGVSLSPRLVDLLGQPLDGVEVVLAGDVFYEKPLAERSLAWFRSCGPGHHGAGRDRGGSIRRARGSPTGPASRCRSARDRGALADAHLGTADLPSPSGGGRQVSYGVWPPPRGCRTRVLMDEVPHPRRARRRPGGVDA